jgi:hypothetical protein
VKYALLIYVEEGQQAQTSPQEMEEMMKGYWEFGNEHEKQILAGEALDETSSATTVRVRDGEMLTTDGPFAETKEQLGGFYIVDAKDLDEALKIGSKIPGATRGSIEVRPVWEPPAPS